MGGAQLQENKIPFLPGRWPTNWSKIIPKKFSHCCESLQPQPGDLTKRLGIPRESDLEGQQDLLIGFPWDCGKQRLQSWSAQSLACTKTQREGAVIPREIKPKLPASVGGSPVEVSVGRGSSQNQEHWQPRSCKVPHGISPLRGCH